MTIMFDTVRALFKKRVAELEELMLHTRSNDEFFQYEKERDEIYAAAQALGDVENEWVIKKGDFNEVLDALTGLYDEVKRNGMGVGRQYRQAAGIAIEKHKK